MKCRCKFTDAWRCARDHNLRTVACYCECHRQQASRKQYGLFYDPHATPGEPPFKPDMRPCVQEVLAEAPPPLPRFYELRATVQADLSDLNGLKHGKLHWNRRRRRMRYLCSFILRMLEIAEEYTRCPVYWSPANNQTFQEFTRVSLHPGDVDLECTVRAYALEAWRIRALATGWRNRRLRAATDWLFAQRNANDVPFITLKLSEPPQGDQ